MATFRRGNADTEQLGAVPSRRTFAPARRTSAPARRATLIAGIAMLGLLTACGTSTPQKLPGTAEPASGDQTANTGSSIGSGTNARPTRSTASAGSDSASSSAGSGSSGTRCHTFELRASVGDNNPGAGQENFPIVLTNASKRTCTLRGYPGAAFVDASGKQLGPDPKRSSDTPTTVTLTPGQSAWAGLTFSNPEISEARAATPATLLVTPPDEKVSLTVRWTGGKVPVSGNSSSVFLTVVRSGTGA